MGSLHDGGRGWRRLGVVLINSNIQLANMKPFQGHPLGCLFCFVIAKQFGQVELFERGQHKTKDWCRYFSNSSYNLYTMNRKRFLYVVLALFWGCLGLTLLWEQGVAWQPSPRVEETPGFGEPAGRGISSAQSSEQRYMVLFEAKADLTPLTQVDSLVTRREAMMSLLMATAVSSQQAVQPLLTQLQETGHISRIQPFWITNAIGVTGDPEALRQLALHPAVASVREEQVFQFNQTPLNEAIQEPILASMDSDPNTTHTAWGVSQVRAPYAWHGLGIDGQGVTVAIMDSGVDWLHPDLHNNYRGNLGNGSYQHEGNWFNAADPSVLEPVDWMWHGTHVAGTAVGQNHIGVAPGAQWIAVAIADAFGNIYESAIHAGFQWLLAPAGDPALAPNIINGSWGSSNPYWTALVEDIDVLKAAGIIPVFSAGNAGPWPETVGAPASYPSTLAVGASDDAYEIAWFSSRGPSPLTDLPKPYISAPGTRILSAYPGAQYAYASGTSMATPHVSGAIALMLSANANLTEEAVWQRLAETAVPMSATHPNNDSGWGNLDAFAAVLPDVPTGSIQGIIHQSGLPIANAIITATNSAAYAFRFTSDENGRYEITLQPGTYTIAISAFGFQPVASLPITLVAGQAIPYDYLLEPLPAGLIQGQVLELQSNKPLTATITAEGTPITAVANSQGQYQLQLPAGTYTLIAELIGYRLAKATVTVSANGTIIRSFQLATSPKILLLEAGAWYYQSHIQAYQDALSAQNYYAHLWPIKDPFHNIPLTTTLNLYDTVIWADPSGAPGYIGADFALSHYLMDGGNLLLSGQNIAAYDGQGPFTAYWWYRLLQGSYLGKWPEEEPPPIVGILDTFYAGLNFSLTGPGTATAQYPDRTTPAPGALSEPILQYPNQESAGLQAGLCADYRLVYFGFGLEGVSEITTRSELLARSIDYFQSPRQNLGVQWRTSSLDDFAILGQENVYELQLQNLSELLTDTFTIVTSSDLWATSLVTTTLELGPCSIGKTVLAVDVPADAPRGITHTVWVTAVSSFDPAIADTLFVQHQVPNHILLVDDDRWYEYEAQYQTVLDTMHVIYDVWDTGGTITTTGRGSPSLPLLRQYDIVLWFTGYDWFQPITPQERVDIETYLREGGRLFLSSQDYLYYNFSSSLTRNFLGVYNYQESITTTEIYAGLHTPLTDPLGGPYSLDYGKAQNNSDGLTPLPPSQAIAWNQHGAVTALATTNNAWRTVFWSLPFEFLTDTVRTEAMHGVLGWLGDLGNSAFAAQTRQGQPGELITYVVTIGKIPAAPTGPVTMTNQLPEELALWLPTLPPELAYDAQTRTLVWHGMVEEGSQRQFHYQAQIAPGTLAGTRVENRVTLQYPQHALAFDRVATIWVETPDLSGSQVAGEVFMFNPYQFVWYTMTLQNVSPVAAQAVTAVLHIPSILLPAEATLEASAGTAVLEDQQITWQGSIPGQATVTISILTWRTIQVGQDWVAATAFVDDGVTQPLVRMAVSHLPPFRQYFPMVSTPPD